MAPGAGLSCIVDGVFVSDFSASSAGTFGGIAGAETERVGGVELGLDVGAAGAGSPRYFLLKRIFFSKMSIPDISHTTGQGLGQSYGYGSTHLPSL